MLNSEDEKEFPVYLLYILVYSNFIYFLAACVLAYQVKRFWFVNRFVSVWVYAIADCIFLSLISAFHHQCNNHIIEYCVMDEEMLGWLDDFYSIWIISSIINIHMWNRHLELHLCRSSLWIITLILVIFNRTNEIAVITPILICNLLILIRIRNNVYKLPMLFAGIFIVIARVVKAYDSKADDSNNMYHYTTYHSLWHLFSGLAIIANILSIKVQPVNNEIE